MKKKIKEVEENSQYFAEREEQAVIDYINSNSIEEKNKLYNEILVEPFRKMKETILRRYPVHIGNYEMEEVESYALTHLIEHMIKYRPFIVEYRQKDLTGNEKWTKCDYDGRFFLIEDAKAKLNEFISIDSDFQYRLFESKAFSYCQTIIRNYYKDHGRKTYAERKINLNYDDYVDEINQNSEYSYEIEIEGQHLLEKLINDVIEKIENRINGDVAMKKNEVIVGDAIVNILKNWHLLFMEETPEGKYNKRVTNKFAKNKILLYLKEQTGLNTKEIRIGIKPFKEIYFIQKMDYLDD